MACKVKEKFVFYYIKQLLDSNFGRKFQLSTIGPLPALVPLALPSSTPGPSALVSAYTPIHSTQPSVIKPTHETYSTLAALDIPAPSIWSTGLTRGAYMQLSGPIFVAYIQLLGTRLPFAALGIGRTSATYMQPSGIKALPGTYMQ